MSVAGECVGWDGEGRTQDIRFELEVVSVSRQPSAVRRGGT
jgi:hypothetical protein